MMKSQGLIRKTFILLLAGTLLLAACQRFNPPPPAQVTTETPALAVTGGPSVTVRDQPTDGSKVEIEKVISEVPGWVAIHIVVDGKVVPDTIGNEHVDAGETNNVVVELEPGKATEEMIAMLHIDAGTIGEYEFPGGPDDPVEVGGQVVAPRFRVELAQASPGTASSVTPTIDVKSQEIINGIVKIANVVSPEAGWVVIYDDHGEKLGDAIGTAAVQAGENPNLIIPVDPNHMSADLYAKLHIDAGEVGVPEIPGRDNPDAADVPLTVNDQEVLVSFQHLGLAAAEEATAVAGGEATPPAGTEVAATHGNIHDQAATTPSPDETAIAFPSGMATVTPKEGVNPVVQVSDQEIQDGAILIENVVSVGSGWVVIWTLPENGGSEAIGFTQVQDGENPNVSVPVEASKATPQMLAILHLDVGQQGVFEQGADFPVHVGIQMIQTAFNITGAATAQSTEPVELPFKVVADDQPLRGGDTVIIAEVVSDGPGWVGIHLTEPNGEMSHTAAIGAGALQDGLNTNVVVRLNNPARATDKLWGMLHYDKEPIGDYNFPNDPGNDVPVKVNGQDVVDDFLVTGGLVGQKVVINVASVGGTPILVDGQGFSLYSPGFGECNDDQCLKEWRPLVATGGAVPGAGVTGLVSVRGLGDGTRQITYNGLPLYYSLGDFKPGDTNGYLQEDGRWLLATP